ncbi:hypothetical protein [Actinomadura sp. RB99]|uniref:hypothetical protein n=1 Tax=Actinomadura sp. RB99 TaxID=2691577 RepID=UPI00168A3849|nr:hypothetical protein [Actinomadura sp. RB99]
MTGRIVILTGALTAATSAVGLIVYFAVKGLHWGDTVGVIGAVVGHRRSGPGGVRDRVGPPPLTLG